MPFTVNTSEEFDAWFQAQEDNLKDRIAAAIQPLEVFGPRLGRPHVDTLKDSSLSNLKELRVQYRGEPYRILFAFDPRREALLLVGGNKAGDKRFYKTMIPKAEAIFQKHLDSLKKES